jgi:serine/threonine protein kinase
MYGTTYLFADTVMQGWTLGFSLPLLLPVLRPLLMHAQAFFTSSPADDSCDAVDAIKDDDASCFIAIPVNEDDYFIAIDIDDDYYIAIDMPFDDDDEVEEEDIEHPAIALPAVTEEHLLIPTVVADIDPISVMLDDEADSSADNNYIQFSDLVTGRISLVDFEIGIVLGAGTFGKVQLVKHIPTGLIFALKSIDTTWRYDLQYAEHELCSEVYLHSQLNHPGVVQMYAAWVENNQIHLLLEYAPNGTLLDELAYNYPLPEERLWDIMYQLCESIQYIHNQGVMHRDLKPENVVVGLDGSLKLCDFGMATMFQKGEFLDSQCGTCEFMSPELADFCYDERTDIWSFGIIFYQLCYYVLPFDSTHGQDILDQVRNNHVYYPCATPPPELLLLLQKDPDQRISLDQLKKCISKRGFQSLSKTTGFIPASPAPVKNNNSPHWTDRRVLLDIMEMQTAERLPLHFDFHKSIQEIHTFFEEQRSLNGTIQDPAYFCCCNDSCCYAGR